MAGSDSGPGPRAAPPRAALHAWLRRAARLGAAGPPVTLRGSLLLAVYCPARARPAHDVDYLLEGRFDAPATEALVHAIVAVEDPAPLVLERTEITWAETAFPGLRAHLRAGEATFHVDLSAGDPLSTPAREVRLPGLEPTLLAAAPETLFAWKLHGVCEHGTGRWRAKDLYDLDALVAEAPLDAAALRPAVELAFSSRGTALAALDDFRRRDGWGTSRGGVRKWRGLARQVPALGEFLPARARVRAAVDAILGPLQPTPPPDSDATG